MMRPASGQEPGSGVSLMRSSGAKSANKCPGTVALDGAEWYNSAIIDRGKDSGREP